MRHGIAATGQRAVACLGLLTPLGVSAIDTTWIGAASDPFWDLVPNWSAGPPSAATTRALLGGFDTTLRSGDFEVERVQGTGVLTMTGGTLKLSGDGSSLGRLDLHAGALLGPGDLTLGQFRWRGGSLGTSYNGDAPRVTVSGAASIGGAVSMGFPAVFDGTPLLRLNGVTTWEDGNSTIDVGAGTNSLVVGATGVLNDHAATGNHGVAGWQAGLRNEGRYEKTGAGTTSMGALVNDGTMNLREGRFEVNADAGSNTFNGGTLNVLGGTFDAHLFRSGIDNFGRIDVSGGSMRILAYSSGVGGTGDWHVGPGAELSIDAGWGSSSWGILPNRIDAGTWRSDGTLRLMGANLDLRLGPAARLEGNGLVEILQGAQVKVGGDVTLGALRIGPAYRLQDQNGFYGNALSRLDIAGALTVGMLDWSDGTLAVGGPVTVNGPATLTQDIDKILESTLGGPVQLGKRIDVPYRFNGGVTWDGRADLYGSGSIAIAADTVFEDQNRRGTLEVDPGTGWILPRPTRVSVAKVDNAGTWLKTGAGATEIASVFTNTGTVRALDAAGSLTFSGPLDNRGTLEAVRSRVVMHGPLAQLSDGVLSGGRYVMRDGQLVLNFGANAAGTGPMLLGQNAADITLDGPRARLATTWMASDLDALSGLGYNTGRLALRNGAVLEATTAYSLFNQGTIEVSGGSRLAVVGTVFSDYVQQPAGADPLTAATWLDGTLAAAHVQLGGLFGAGGADTVGQGRIDTQRLTFQGVVFDVDVADLLRFDVVSTTGITTLDGTIVVDFDDPAHALGTYRVLTSDVGISGTFGAVQSNLDAALYRVGAVYGANYVDLRVSAVPEPHAGLLAGLGLLGLAGLTRRRRAAG